MEISAELRAREREALRDEGRLTAALDEAAYLAARGRAAEAIARLETLPQDIRVLEALSLAWQAAGEPAKALAVLEQAVALDPSRLDLRVRLQDLRTPKGGG